MNKIPVGRTIAFAYDFTFRHIGTIIGLVWLPLLVLYVGQFFVMNYYAEGIESFVSGADPSAAGRSTLALIGFVLVTLLLIAMIGVSITRQAMGLRKGGAVVQFSLGAAEFNLFSSYLAAIAVLIAIDIAVFLAAVVVGVVGTLAVNAIVAPNGASAVREIATVAGAIAFLVTLGALVYVVARLTFLIAPVTVTEGKIDLIRAWTLTKGNFWRIFAIAAATVLPVSLIFFVAEAIIIGPANSVPDLSVPTDAAAQMQQMAAQLRAMTANMPLLLGLGFLLAPFNYGLIFSAPAFAYRTLVSAPPAPLPDTGPMRPA